MIVLEKKCNKRSLTGFTLMELILVMMIIGIISAIAIPKVGNFIENSQVESTKREMRHLVRGFLGDHDEGFYGFKDNIGDLPDELPGGPALDALFEQGTFSAYDPFTQLGWNGPYVDTRTVDIGGSPEYDLKYDVWGNAYVYDKDTPSTITSNGPDGTASTGDDIVVTIE